MRSLILVAALCLALPASAQDAPPLISVTGTGTVATAPDMAVIRLGVTGTESTAEAAMAGVSAATAEVIARLETAGVASKDIQTSELSIQPIRASYDSSSGGEPRITGFEARNAVTVRVRALSGLGDVLDSVLDAGANTFDGISFALQDPDPVLDEARKLAVGDAMRKAALYAEAAGLTLGPVLEIREGGYDAGPVPMLRMAAEAMPVQAGEVDTSASITMIFSLGQP